MKEAHDTLLFVSLHQVDFAPCAAFESGLERPRFWDRLENNISCLTFVTLNSNSVFGCARCVCLNFTLSWLHSQRQLKQIKPLVAILRDTFTVITEPSLANVEFDILTSESVGV